MLIQQTAKLGKVLEIPANSRANSSDFFEKIRVKFLYVKKNDYICYAEWQHSRDFDS